MAFIKRLGSACKPQLFCFGVGCIGFSSPSESFESIAFVVPESIPFWAKLNGFVK